MAGSVLAVRLPNWLGDACLAMRAVDALERRFPEGDLVLIGRPWARALFQTHWPRALWLEAPPSGGRWLPYVPALARVRAATSVLFPPSLSARLHALFAGVPERVGLANEPGDFLLTKRAPRGALGSRHLEDEYLDLARVLGAEATPRRALVAADARTGGAEPGPTLVVAPGARYGPAKRWPAERFAETARLWALSRPEPERATVVLVGGEEDRAETRAVLAASPPGPYVTVDKAGATTMTELAGQIARADAVLSNDSGVAHLAAALLRPTAVVFGSTDPRWTAPRGSHVAVLAHPPDCAPCFLKRCAIADRYRCLRAVDPAEVAGAIEQLVHRPSGQSASWVPAARGGSAPMPVPRSPGARRRAVFLDRDGTLMPELGYLGDPTRARLLPGVGAALRILERAGYALVVVTNQSAIGRGLISEADVARVHDRLSELVRAEHAEISALYVCPHHPDEDCPCRKPKPGLLEQAIADLSLERNGSWMVGDGAKDVQAGRAAGVTPLLVLTGWGQKELGTALREGLPPEDALPDLLAAAERIAASG